MSGPTFEKVLLDKSFKHCKSIYDRLSNILDDVDLKKVGDISQINAKIIALNNDMHMLLCIAESLVICDQKVKEDRAKNSGQRTLQETFLQKVTRNAQTPTLSNLVASTSKISKVHQEMSTDTLANIYNTISYKDDGYKCNFCAVIIKNIDSVILHNNSREHKAICKNPQACFENILNDSCNIDALWSFVPLFTKISKIYIQPTGFSCILCDCDLPYSVRGIYTHIKGKQHIKKLPDKLQSQE